MEQKTSNNLPLERSAVPIAYDWRIIIGTFDVYKRFELPKVKVPVIHPVTSGRVSRYLGTDVTNI